MITTQVLRQTERADDLAQVNRVLNFLTERQYSLAFEALVGYRDYLQAQGKPVLEQYDQRTRP